MFQSEAIELFKEKFSTNPSQTVSQAYEQFLSQDAAVTSPADKAKLALAYRTLCLEGNKETQIAELCVDGSQEGESETVD